VPHNICVSSAGESEQLIFILLFFNFYVIFTDFTLVHFLWFLVEHYNADNLKLGNYHGLRLVPIRFYLADYICCCRVVMNNIAP